MFCVFLFQFSKLAFAVGGNLRGEDNEDKTDNQVKNKTKHKITKNEISFRIEFNFC